MNEILAAIQSLSADGKHPSTIRVAMLTPGRWECLIGLDDYCSLGEAETIKVDRADMPDGVRLLGFEKFPDEVFTIDGSAEHIETCVRQVSQIGGAPDWARFDREDGAVSYVTKPVKWLRASTKQVVQSAAKRSANAG